MNEVKVYPLSLGSCGRIKSEGGFFRVMGSLKNDEDVADN